jgi:hypothetical protein
MLNYLVTPLAVTKGIDVRIVITHILFIIARTKNLEKKDGSNYG